MKGDFDILWYLVPLAIGLLKFVFKDKASKPVVQNQGEVILPQQEVDWEQEPVTDVSKRETLFEEKLQNIAKKTDVENRNKSFLSRNPYEESIEYRKKKVKKREEQKSKQITEELSQNDYFSEIDWKKAVVFSEILKPRF